MPISLLTQLPFLCLLPTIRNSVQVHVCDILSISVRTGIYVLGKLPLSAPRGNAGMIFRKISHSLLCITRLHQWSRVLHLRVNCDPSSDRNVRQTDSPGSRVLTSFIYRLTESVTNHAISFSTYLPSDILSFPGNTLIFSSPYRWFVLAIHLCQRAVRTNVSVRLYTHKGILSSPVLYS
jgi:hypothetical protein